MSSLQKYFSNAPKEFSGELKLDEPLAKYTYYQIGGPASVLATPKSQEDLNWIWKGISETGSDYFLLGAGSNILISDDGFKGVVIRLGKLSQELMKTGDRVVSGGSIMISMLLRRASQEGWGGLELLTGIPGTVGGAVRMNAGTHLGETQSKIYKVTALVLGKSIEQKIYQGSDLKFQYRKNLFLPENSVVWSAEWNVTQEDPALVKARIDENLLRRKQTQPVDFPSCGSVFKNPKESGKSAWQVLDQLGLRGHRIGNAQIAEKHSNFIINLGGAKASDVKGLIDLAKTRALQEIGIILQEEVIYVGNSKTTSSS